MNNYLDEMLYRKNRRSNEFDEKVKLEKRINELENELSNVQSQRDWWLKEIDRLNQEIKKKDFDLLIYRNRFWTIHD